jgi:hypothetical protein
MRMPFGALIAFAALSGPVLADDVSPRPADGRVAYLQFAEHDCKLGVWDSKSRTSHIIGSLPACPDAVSVTSHEQVLVLIYPTDIRVVNLGDGKIGDPIRMPADAVTKGRDKEASLAGYTSDGALALRLFGMGPDNRDVSQVFLFKGNSWVKVDEKPCGDYSDECPPQPTINARELDDIYGLGPNGLFNESLTADPYVVRRSSWLDKAYANQSAEGDDEDVPEEGQRQLHNSLAFHVYGRYTKLLFDTVPGEDTAGIYTFWLKLVLPDERTVMITSEQYGATLVGHYLLYYGFFGNGVKLYDVGNGEVVLDNLGTAGWLN